MQAKRQVHPKSERPCVNGPSSLVEGRVQPMLWLKLKFNCAYSFHCPPNRQNVFCMNSGDTGFSYTE